VKSQLDRILRIADGLQKLLTDEALRAKASDVVAWCEAEAYRTIEQPSLVEGETHGFVKQIHAATHSEKGLEARQVKLVGTGGVQSRYGIVKNVLSRFGFIRTESGAELFFHRNSMVCPSDWNRIDAGVRVQFEMGVNAKGPVAEKVQLRE